MPSAAAEITRFAPSPTGPLHLGHAYAALVARDLARGTGGRFLLRMDDLDQGRCRPEFETMIYADLAWLGVTWETPVRRQSECGPQYCAALERLREAGLIYPCFCTRKEILRESARAQDAPHEPAGPVYPGTCRNLSAALRAARIGAGKAHTLRLDLDAALARAGPRPKFIELGAGPGSEQGEIRTRPELFGDIVLARGGNGGGASTFAYHLAVVVDDAHQGVSCVTRGCDLFYAAHVQRLLQVLLGLPAPRYLHHALAADAAGNRLAKRHDALSLRQLRERGIHPGEVRDLIRFTNLAVPSDPNMV